LMQRRQWLGPSGVPSTSSTSKRTSCRPELALIWYSRKMPIMKSNQYNFDAS